MPRSREPDYAGDEWVDVPTAEELGHLKPFGGSQNDDFNDTLVNQATDTVSRRHPAPQRKRQRQGVMGAMLGIRPNDEIEGMIIAQIIATHNAVMECHRRAMLDNERFEVWREALNQASKLSRSWAGLVNTLDRHRGKGQQQIRVEHVHVNKGGQAIVGSINGAGRFGRKREENADGAKAIAYQPETPMRRADPQREAMPVATDDREEAL
jgi:hypothetical protein